MFNPLWMDEMSAPKNLGHTQLIAERETIKHLHKSSKRGTISKQIMTFKFSILTISPNNLFLPLNNAQCMKNYFSCNSTSTLILNSKQKVETQCPLF